MLSNWFTYYRSLLSVYLYIQKEKEDKKKKMKIEQVESKRRGIQKSRIKWATYPIFKSWVKGQLTRGGVKAKVQYLRKGAPIPQKELDANSPKWRNHPYMDTNPEKEIFAAANRPSNGQPVWHHLLKIWIHGSISKAQIRVRAAIWLALLFPFPSPSLAFWSSFIY